MELCQEMGNSGGHGKEVVQEEALRCECVKRSMRTWRRQYFVLVIIVSIKERYR